MKRDVVSTQGRKINSLSVLKFKVKYTPVIPALGRGKKEGQKFKVILSYMVSLRPVWAS